MDKPKLNFYNPYRGNPFKTDDYDLERDRRGKARAVSWQTGQGKPSYRYVSESFYRRYA